MPTRYKTQCPRCHTIYPMPDDKLDQPKARANCGKCHHTFFLNLHIISPKEEADNQTIASQLQAAATTNTNSTKLEKNSPKKQPVITDDMLFDDKTPIDDGDDESEISLDGLDDFLHQDIQITQPVTAATKATALGGVDDEAWLDDLLKDSSPKIDTAAINTRPNDDLSKIIGTDFASVIPAVAATERMDKAAILKKVQERIDSHAPSQEQLAKKRSPLRHLAWAIGCVALLGLMAVQYTLFNLEPIIKNPEKASILQSVCSTLPCNLPSADNHAFSTTYELSDGIADFTTNLVGNLSNNSNNNQLYPNLKVSIQGHAGLLGDFIATPKDYLASEQYQLAPTQHSRFMLTIVDISKDEITAVNIEPFY